MSRDALLVLLALVVLLNLTMLLQAVLVLRRRSSAASEQRRETAALRRRVPRRGERAVVNVPPAFPAPAPAPRATFVGPPSLPPARQPLIAAVDASGPWASAATAEVRPAARPHVRQAATPDVRQAATPDVRQAAAEQPPQPAEATPPAAAELVTAEPVTAELVTAELVTAEPVTAEPVTAEPGTAEPAAAKQEAPSAHEATAAEAAEPTALAAEPTALAPEPSAPEPVSAEPSHKPPARRSPSGRGMPQKSRGGSRGRRFVLPPLDEDHARSARAIEAFLGGPPEPAATAAERPPRRRHRVRRPAGTPAPKTTLVVSLKGYAELELALGATRTITVAVAFSDALRRSARSTDELRELGGGRLRIIVEADDAGANAYLDRARASIQPWLELLPVPLRLDVGQRKSEIIAFDGARRMAGG